MAPFRCDPVFFQNSYDFVLRPVLFQEHSVYGADQLDFFWRTWNKNDAVSLDALPFAAAQHTFVVPVPATQHSPKANPCGAALAIAKFNEPALSKKDFGGQLAAIFRGHRAFYGFNDRGCDAAII